MRSKGYDLVRCSKHTNEHVFNDLSILKGIIESNRCPICHPNVRDEETKVKRQARINAKQNRQTLPNPPATNTTTASTLQGRCKLCDEWCALNKMNRHYRRKHKTNNSDNSTSNKQTNSNAFHLQQVPRNCITSDQRFINEAEKFPVGRLVMGFENAGLWSPYQRQPQVYGGKVEKSVRQRHIHSCLDLLRNLLHNPHFVADLLEYPEVKAKVNEELRIKCNESVEEGAKMLADHIGGASPLLLLATGCLGTVWDRMVTIICHTTPDLYSNELDRIHLIQDLNEMYVNGVSTSKPQKCLQKLQVRELGEYVTEQVEKNYGYDHCKEMRLFTKLAKDIARWCLDKENEVMKEAVYSLLGSSGGHHVKLIYCWYNNIEYQSKKRYRSANVRLTSSSGHEVRVPSLPRSDVIMEEKKQHLVGMESSNQIRSCLKKEGDAYCVHYLDREIDVKSLALGFNYTFVGDILFRRGVDGNLYRFRYFDSRVELLCRMYKLWNLNIINNELDGDFTIELSEWHDDSKIEKAGRLDFSIQMRMYPQALFRENLTDKQKSHIKKVMVILYTWNYGDVNTMNLLCELAAEDRMDRGCDFYWVNPSNQRQHIFFKSTRSLADNKDANLESGKVAAGGTGHLRCKQCNGNVSDEAAAMYTTEIEPITFQTLLDRIERNHLEEKNNHFGLVRPCSHFTAHFTSRYRYDCSALPLHVVLNYLTENRILSKLSRTEYIQYDTALKWYQVEKLKLCDVTFSGLELKCRLQEKRQSTNISIKLSEDTKWIHCQSRTCHCIATTCYHLIAPLIYLHFNRKKRTLKDFELDKVKRWSDASHNIPGIFDRTMEWFRDETPLLTGEDKYDSKLEEIRIKQQFGDFVTKSNMNHSDKKLCALNSPVIQFGVDDAVVVNYEPQLTRSRVFQEALNHHVYGHESDESDSELEPAPSLMKDSPQMPTSASQQSGSSSDNTPQQATTNSSSLNNGSICEPSHISTSAQASQNGGTQPTQSQSTTLPTADMQSDDDNKKATISIEPENAKWILTCISLLTAMSVLPYSIWSRDKKQFAFIYHWASLLYTKLVFHRWGKAFTNSNYIHDDFRHMADLFEVEPFVDCSTDEFEEFFAELKYGFRTSCHKKPMAELSISIRNRAKEFLFMIHPSLKRSKSASKITKFLESMFSMKNILIIVNAKIGKP